MKNKVKFVPTAQSDKKVNLRITGVEGDVDTNELIAEVTQKVIDQHIESKKWAFVNNTVFQFSAEAESNPSVLLADAARLYELLASTEGDITVTLAGDLVGGRKVTITVDDDKYLPDLFAGEEVKKDLSKESVAELTAKIAALVAKHFEDEEVKEQLEELNPPVFEFDDDTMDDPIDFAAETQNLLQEVLNSPNGKVVLRPISSLPEK